jgi:hypothetical protein
MTAVPSLLIWNCVGYCAKAAGAAARPQTSNPNPSQVLADRITILWILWVLDIVNGSFFFYPRIEQPG